MSRVYKTLLIILTAGAIFAPAVSLRAAGENYYTSAMNEIHAIAESPNVRLLRFGKSFERRAIPALAISDFSSNLHNKTRIFILTGQHGDEYAPVKSILSLCNKIASNEYPDVLRDCIFIVVPIANPDGLTLAQRLNAQGLDINRDWSTLQTREAKFVDLMIRNWKPNVLIDVHEWLNPSPIPGNSIEVAKCVRQSQESEMAILASKVSPNSHLSVLQCTPSSNKALFHRRYALLGYGAYLLETSAGTSFDQRDKTYVSAILTITKNLSKNPEASLALSPASAAFDASVISANIAPISKKPIAKSGFTACIALLAGYGLMVYLIKTSTNKEKTNWSHRFKKCSMEEDIQIDPMACRHKLQPITAKSWVNRRLRLRYVKDRSIIMQTTNNSEIEDPPTIFAPYY